ncbi:hypothetical protein CKM354_001030700 [Cercospora kikuchii]|uniref:Phospholipase C n=1 Tax=Cercospora kikuchii TaxID=84275 RepID=A0A9P3FGZ8_9PEZI|nr:uncharacterized protein CKM354_001030700 [Cercospora kikuchii]GIZ47208.1 hypothetical protein CKM354_001030700 [Cercospora kikuchii]
MSGTDAKATTGAIVPSQPDEATLAPEPPSGPPMGAELSTDAPITGPVFESMLFGEGPEHKFLGNCIDLWFPSASGGFEAKRADITPLGSSFNQKHQRYTSLKFGMIVQLAGDFYTTWSGMEPISDSPDSDRFSRFKSAFDSLIEDKDDYLRDVMAKLAIQDEAIRKAQNLNVDPATIYHNTGAPFNQPTDFDFSKVTSFKYPKIAYRNLDHFGNDARKCYQIGHDLACQTANEARSLTGDEQIERLKKAYMYDAFACHYLTDLFSSGHVRVPRRNLHDDSLFTAYTGGAAERPVWDVQARYMHDDDSATGLMVWNGFRDEWIAYGDKQLFSPQCRVNARHCVSAVQASVNEVLEWFKHGAAPERNTSTDRKYNALRWAPETQFPDNQHGIDYNNPAPLWRVEHSFSEGFGFRSNLDDHANFAASPGKPGYVVYPFVSDAAKNVQTATFRQDHKQYPGARPLEVGDCGRLMSGGFVQVSTQPVASDRSNARSNIRFWCPIIEPALGKGDKGLMPKEQQLITLRCINMRPVDASLRFLHCLTFAEDAVTVVIRFYYQEAAGWTKTVFARAQFFRNKAWSGNKTDQNSRINDDSPPQFEELGPDSQADVATLEVGGALDLAHMAVTRFFIQPRTQTHPPRAVALSLNLDGPYRNNVKVGILDIDPAGATLTKAYSYAVERTKQYHLVAGPYVSLDNSGQHLFMKCWGNNLWLIAKLDEASRQISSYILPERDDWLQNYQAQSDVAYCSSAATTIAGAKPCLLAFFHNNDPITIILSEKTIQGYQNVNVDTYLLYGNSTWNQVDTYTVISQDSKPIYKNYFVGALPHKTGDGEDHFDLLKISGRKDPGTKKSYLMIQLLRKQDGQTPSWAQSYVESLIEDPLQDDPNFYSLRFIRCVFEKSYGSFIQVYSYYGVLGYRVFNRDDVTGVYKLGGQVSYMGQPSQVPGLGNYGQWGCGIMPWGQTEPWLDEAYFTVANNGSNIAEKGNTWDGSWGINKQDFSRRLRDGMDPNDRPEWCLW